eukprot:TRINITY_DN1761_c0_g1_i1.p2 TRINITY_DN1761_c0_g1~~TRINITY_DN1761_c0_g1_i1.p2  ORF type:complete len:170 (+),score=40.33 TRINITY_DN1761_c0_g1_i1:218-727(+)
MAAKHHMLPRETFKTVVASTPLVSIDLILRRHRSSSPSFLLGLRNNAPASGSWFVPGGRILKDERVEDAFERITAQELGRRFALTDCHFKGVYQHLYHDSSFDDAVTTHYVVLAYEMEVEDDFEPVVDEQHSQYRWFERTSLLADDCVHVNTKAYFDAAAAPTLVSPKG